MLNRRNALTAAATLPALAVPAAVTGAMPDTSESKLRALEAEIYQAWDSLGSVLEILEAGEKALSEWEKQNPKPESGELTQGEIQMLYRRLMGEKGPPDDSCAAEYEKNKVERKRVMAAWETRHEAAKEETGYNRANQLESQAGDRLGAAIDAMCDTPATTMEGLRCKARAAAKIDSGDSDLAWSMVEDLASN
jgi:hypothetical protein